MLLRQIEIISLPKDFFFTLIETILFQKSERNFLA
jgi:hypothetical protein